MKGPDRRILLGWELGAGLGHVRRLVDVARRLRDRGWTPYLALADLHALPEDVADVAEGVFQAPGLRIGGVGGRAIPIRSFADVLAVSGYAAELTLAAGVRAWESLLDLIRPRLVLADFSPILHLAAFGRVPVVAVGDGFCVPPALPGGFPVLRRNLRSAVDPEAML
ncbi:MAG: hypothetical protein MUF66_01200, partial [Gammaproteobacteria bacterium]|nr:hypothetical protein [Gammaproteobacteria bacterium]